MKWSVLSLIACLCLASMAAAEETKLVEKTSLDLKSCVLMPGSSFNPGYWQKEQNGLETLNKETRKDRGFKITATVRFDNADKIWGKIIHSQFRFSYQNFRAETDFWEFRHTDYGPADESFFVHQIKHQSVSVQPFIGTDIVAGKNWSLRLFSTMVPSLTVEKNNGTYNISSSMSLFAELSLWDIALFEAGYGFRMPITFREDKNLTVDNGWYFGLGSKIWDF